MTKNSTVHLCNINRNIQITVRALENKHIPVLRNRVFDIIAHLFQLMNYNLRQMNYVRIDIDVLRVLAATTFSINKCHHCDMAILCNLSNMIWINGKFCAECDTTVCGFCDALNYPCNCVTESDKIPVQIPESPRSISPEPPEIDENVWEQLTNSEKKRLLDIQLDLFSTDNK